MTNVFLKVLNMSISAGYVVLAVLLLRLVLKKAPKWIAVTLWGIVAVRLICPFSFESVLSLIPSAEVVSPDIMLDRNPQINSGIPIVNQVINPVISESFAPDPMTSANPLQLWIPTFAAIWILGMIAMLVYTVVSYARVKHRIGTAVRLRDNIYQSESVVSPFVLGIFTPKIYLPFNMNEQNTSHVIAHEQAHIRRRDHLWKPLGFLLLTLHWFNPLMWLGYVLLCRDIELACDEKVIKKLDDGQRADYSEALLACSVNRRMLAACPLAFGEVGVKKRIKSALNYKKPAFWIIIGAIVISIVVAVCFLTNPTDDKMIGVQSISIKNTDFDTLELKIRYLMGYGKYSVTWLRDDQIEYTGDGAIPYDGSLGKYRIMVTFEDADRSEAFKKKYPIGEVFELDDQPIKILGKIVGPAGHRFVLYLGFDVPVAVDIVEGGEIGGLMGTVKIPITVLPDDRVATLKARYPEYFDLDASNGLDVIVSQMADNSYSFKLTSHSEYPFDSYYFEAIKMPSLSAVDMRHILSTYDIDYENDVYIVPWQNPFSSYIPDYNIIMEGEYREYKLAAFKQKIRKLLFGDDLNITELPQPTLVYSSTPSYTMHPSQVPLVSVNEKNQLFNIISGKVIANVKETTIDESDFLDVLPVLSSLPIHLFERIAENNAITYEVIPTKTAAGIGIYYLLIQKDGSSLLVYGDYSKDTPRSIRWVFDLGHIVAYNLSQYSAIFDVDGDGEDEICSISNGSTQYNAFGFYSVKFTVKNAETGEVKYANDVHFRTNFVSLSFVKCDDGAVRVQAVSPQNEVFLLDVSVHNDYVYLKSNGTTVGFVVIEKAGHGGLSTTIKG